MDRRHLLVTSFAGALAAPRVVWAQPSRADNRLVHVGVLGFGSGMLSHPLKAFRERLAEFGYVEGQNLVIDQRYANGRRELSRISVIWDSLTPSYQLEALKAGARSIAVHQEILTVTTHDDFETAFSVASRSHAEAMVILSSPLVSSYGELLAGLSIAHHLPTVSMFRENVAVGCLMAYGPSLVDGWRRLGSFVGRVLKGARAGDLPIERPTTFELVVNLKTAKTLGLTIPPSLLARADEVIQ